MSDEQSTVKRPSKRLVPRLSIHLRRIEASMKVFAPDGAPRETLPIRITIKDLSLTGVGMFLPRIVPPSDSVEITFQGLTKPLTLRGRIVWCEQVQQSTTRILSPEKFGYRGGVEFTFKSKEEEHSLLLEYEILARELMTGVPNSEENAVKLETATISPSSPSTVSTAAPGDPGTPAPSTGLSDSNINEAAALLDQLKAETIVEEMKAADATEAGAAPAAPAPEEKPES